MTTDADWSRFTERVAIKGSLVPLAGEWPEEARGLGLRRFPPSYLAYLRRFGAGTWTPRLFVGPPVHALKTATVGAMSERFRSMVRVMVEGGDYREPDRLLRMIKFAGDGSGLSVCWDVAMGDRDGELAISLVYEETLDIYECSFDLLDFLDRIWCRGEINRILNQDAKTKAVFTPYVVQS